MKLRSICKSKIHRAVVTAADLHYVGSVGIDAALMRMTDIIEGERVSLWNINNGQRIETYAIPLPEGSGQIAVDEDNRFATFLQHQGAVDPTRDPEPDPIGV
jgi:aspartate 1-decarboxylase